MNEQTQMHKGDREVTVIKRADKPASRAERYADSLLHVLIEENFDRAKLIIEKIARSRRQSA